MKILNSIIEPASTLTLEITTDSGQMTVINFSKQTGEYCVSTLETTIHLHNLESWIDHGDHYLV